MAGPLGRYTCSRHVPRSLGQILSFGQTWALNKGAAGLPRRFLQTSVTHPHAPPSFAFAFDIDGVLLRSTDPLPGAKKALSYLQSSRIPFILLTNGGGKLEADRVHELSERLDIPFDTSMFVQSHTPFAQFNQFKDKTVLVVGGDHDKCRKAAETYGFKSVVMPCDIFAADPTIWPFSSRFLDMHREDARPLPNPLPPFSAIFVYNDPRDWGLDLTVVLDLLLSQGGELGTLSPLNNRDDLPNRGYQQDGQPELWFSNPDLWWPAKHALPRLGQGGFREALEGIWAATTGGPGKGVKLHKNIIGKPFYETYEFAENRLVEHRHDLLNGQNSGPLKTVYMIGDNPESDIRGGNSYKSARGIEWRTLLVKTGVYKDGENPPWKPTRIVEDVWDAVQWALKKECRE